ncbi:MAG: LapA family protein [Nitriliruptor sp.]|nr:MAG: LapA family protein [Nitriliruptor sp.]
MVALLLAVVAMVFVLQNRGETTLAFFGVSFAAPLWLYTLIALLVGGLIGALLSRRKRSG